MRYLCVHCDEKFELVAEAELRCPKCMRLHGLRELGQAPAPPAAARGGSSRGRALFLGLAALLAAGASGYAWYLHTAKLDPATLATTPLSQRVLGRELERAGVKPGALLGLLEPDPSVERFARAAAGGASSPDQKASAIAKALRARAQAGGFTRWSLSDPRLGMPKTAAQTLAAITKDGARQQLYPLELAALGVAALRALDVPAMLAEVYAWPGDKNALDPSGRFGYFAVALPQPKAGPRLFDVYGGRPEQASAPDAALLSDLQAVGAALALQALSRLAENQEPAAALRDADAAIKLVPASASVRSARGTVLLSNGASEQGQGELEAAAQMRPDAPRRNNLAMLYLALGDGERAARDVAQVLEQQPDFALGHATLAEIHIARGERDLGKAELERAEALDPTLPILPLTWAQLYAASGQNEQAIEQAKRAVQARPDDPQSHLLLARILRQAARYDEMRAEARAVLALAPPSMNGQMRELIERLLGPTALEPAPEPDHEPAAPAGSAQASQAAPSARKPFDLAQPGSGDHSRLHLLDGVQGAPSDGTLKHADGTPRLRLAEPGKDLKLGTRP